MKQSAEKNFLGLLSTPENLEVGQSVLLSWFAENGRKDIPWKLKDDGNSPKNGELLLPYGIWIAEVMLQQTQFNVALPYWKKWMEVFPTLLDLGKASESKVLLLWQGLGYYSRARRILKAAEQLLDLIGDGDPLDPVAWPNDLETWISLPGVGRSTGASIISSAFDLPAALLDGNVKRVLGRIFAISQPAENSLPELWAISEKLIDRQNPRHFNQALMDLGSLVCKPRNPNCCNCPWQSFCIVYSSDQVKDFPVKPVGKTLPFAVIGVGIVFNPSGEVLIDQRIKNASLGGLWEFPGGKQEPKEAIEVTIARELTEELGIEVQVGERLISFEHSYSHKKLCFVVHLCKWLSGEPQPLESQQIRWVKPNELVDYPFPAANAKMISALNKYLQKEKCT